MIQYSLTFTLLIFSFLNGFGENPPVNPLDVEAGDDLIICAPGQMVTLDGSVNGSFSGVFWDPPFGMSDPESLNPEVFVSATTTFTLTAFGEGATMNLIDNGDFEAGATGFSSSYIPGTGGPFGLLSNEGEYAISTDPALTHNNFASCGDHTSGSGNMMVVNGSSNAGEFIWCQTVAVTPNTIYEFSAWMTSVHPSSPAELQFSINGVLLGDPFNLTSATCSWENFFESWNSGSNTSVEICIINQNTQPSGNDFAIDDITFGPVCSGTDEVTVTVVDVFATANPFESIPCSATNGINLDGNGSTVGPNVTYEWMTTNGNIVSGANTLNPLVDQPGIYVLTVSIATSFGPCEAMATVEVVADIPPTAMAATDAHINCLNTTGFINGFNSSTGPFIEYQWTTTNGFIFNGENDLVAEVSEGTYTLIVTDILTGCTDEAMTEVTADLNPPTADAEPLNNIDCNNTIALIDGSGSSGGMNLAYNWTTINGSITAGSTADTVSVNGAGDYTLTVTNQDNGCTDDVTVAVTANTNPPDINFAMPGFLNCINTNFSLDASASTGGGALAFDWSTINGNIVSGAQTSMPVIDQTGTYTLVLTDASNGCTAEGDLDVDGNTTPPTISIGQPDELTCTNEEVTLDGSGSTGSGTLTFSWTTANGNILSGENTPQPNVNEMGIYTLVITDSANGCSSTDGVEVMADQSLPTAEAGDVVQLDCNASTAQLNGIGSTMGNGITHLWTTADGNIISGETTLQPLINEGGTYILTVTNSATGCTNQDNVIIPENTDVPTAIADQPGMLNCNNMTLTIDGTGSSSGANFSLAWTTANGNFVSGETTLEPVVNQMGTYILTITNLNSNCTATDEVVIGENFTTPQADAGNLLTLTCANDTLQLDGTNSILGNADLISWSTTGGSFSEGENTLMPTITASGSYTLIITNLTSGCTGEASVQVDENMVQPTADAGQPTELTCVITSAPLDGSGSSQNGDFTYLWTTQDGNIVSGENGLSPVVNEDGNYLLTVVNNDNGCENTSNVDVTLNGDFPNAEAGQTAELTCADAEATLGGSSTTGSGTLSFTWTTTDGSILDGENTLTPTVGASGTYVLQVTNMDNGCATTDDVFISENTALPNVDAGPTNELSCTDTELSLNGNGNSPSNDLIYEWTTSNGNIISGENNPDPLVNAAGTYWLTITDNANGCRDSASVEITQDANVPIADAGLTATLTCDDDQLQLDGTGSSGGANIIYEWVTADGNIVSGETTLQPLIDAPGTYLLTVTDVVNDCESISSVTIDENTTQPTANAGPDALLTCAETSAILDGSASANGPDFTYLWTTANGNIISGNATGSPIVDLIGTYQLLVTNEGTGCTNTSTVEVTENTTPPTVFIGTPDVLTCEHLQFELDGIGSSTGADFNYEWTTTNGNILSGENTLNPLINEDGDYVLLITNGLTGCTSTENIFVSENKTLPTADAGPMIELDCNNPTLALDGTGSSTGNGFDYFWITADGNIVSGALTLTPVVDDAGTYTLTVLDETNGCLSTAEVEVTLDNEAPSITVVNPAVLTCTETEITIDATGSSTGATMVYEWTTQNGNIINGQNTLLLTVDESGDYVLIILNNDNGCESGTSVNVDEDVELPAVDAGQTAELHCNFTETNLSANTDVAIGQFMATWTTQNGNIVSGGTGLSPLVDVPGVYQLTVLNTLTGCANTDSVAITENILLGFDFEKTDPTCLVSTGALEFTEVTGGASPFEYSINNGQSFSTNEIYPNLSVGLYDVVVQDANGCTLTDIAFLSDPPEVEVFLETQTIVQLGEPYQLNALTSLPDDDIGTIVWTPDETLSCNDCLDPLATPIQQTTYEVTITSKEGCSASATALLLVRKDLNIYVPNAFSPNGDGFNDIFLIYTGGNGIAQINSFQIFSRWGESVFQQYNFPPNDPQHGWDGKHKGELMNPAVFAWFAEVELIDGTKKLIKGDVLIAR